MKGVEKSTQKITGRPRRTIHIDRETESLLQKDDALFDGTRRQEVYYELLKLGETVNIKRYQRQFTNLNRSVLDKRQEYRKK